MDGLGETIAVIRRVLRLLSFVLMWLNAFVLASNERSRVAVVESPVIGSCTDSLLDPRFSRPVAGRLYWQLIREEDILKDYRRAARLPGSVHSRWLSGIPLDVVNSDGERLEVTAGYITQALIHPWLSQGIPKERFWKRLEASRLFYLGEYGRITKQYPKGELLLNRLNEIDINVLHRTAVVFVSKHQEDPHSPVTPEDIYAATRLTVGQPFERSHVEDHLFAFTLPTVGSGSLIRQVDETFLDEHFFDRFELPLGIRTGTPSFETLGPHVGELGRAAIRRGYAEKLKPVLIEGLMHLADVPYRPSFRMDQFVSECEPGHVPLLRRLGFDEVGRAQNGGEDVRIMRTSKERLRQSGIQDFKIW